MKQRYFVGLLCLGGLLVPLLLSSNHPSSATTPKGSAAQSLHQSHTASVHPQTTPAPALATAAPKFPPPALAAKVTNAAPLPLALNSPDPTQPQPNPSHPQLDNAPLSDEAIRQITDLQSQKQNRTPVEQRINSNLLLAIQRDSGVAPSTSKSVQTNLKQDDSGRALLDLRGTITPDLTSAVTASGGQVVNSFPEYESLRAWLPLAAVEQLASRPDVQSIRPAVRSENHVGKITSQGDAAHKANIARNTYNVTGAGIKIGVLSDSVDHLAASQSAGELGNVTVLSGQAGSGTGEGTAMLEIVHDLAPASSLYFATADGGPAAFANNIKALRNAGCDIIVDDVGYLDESPFQDGLIAQAVSKVTTAGALYFSSAGNSGNKQSNHSGTWEGDFADGGAYSGGGKYHSFGSLTYNTITSSRTDSYAALFWDDPLGKSANDYDLYLLDSTGNTVVAKSDDYQHGNSDPFEFIDQVQNGQRLVVVLSSGSPRYLHLDTGESELAISTAGNVRGHPCAPDAFCVAAMSIQSAAGGAFIGGLVNPLETFSSDGPRRMFFTATGTQVTPGNLTSTGGILRNKPDITAADGVATSVPGFNPFYGTSAAAPHAAAVAALVKSYNTNLTTTQIRDALTTSTLHITVTGLDTASGAGIVMAPSALDYVAQIYPPAAVPVTATAATLALSTSGTTVNLKITGDIGARYQIETSADLTHWQNVATATNLTGNITIPQSLATSSAFYRVESLESTAAAN